MNVVLKQSRFIKPEPFSVLISDEAKNAILLMILDDNFFMIIIFSLQYMNNENESMITFFYIPSLYKYYINDHLNWYDQFGC